MADPVYAPLLAPTEDQLDNDVPLQQPAANEEWEEVEAPAHVRPIGICDNLVQYTRWIDVPEVHRILILGTVNVAPFNTDMVVDPRASAIAYMYANCRLGVYGVATNADIMSLACAEILAPMMARSHLAPEAEARRILVESVAHAIRHNGYTAFTQVLPPQYAELFRHAVPGAEGVPPIPEGRLRTSLAAMTDNLPATWDGVVALGDGLTPNMAMCILIFWATDPLQDYLGLTMLTSTYVAVAKRGQATAQSLNKISRGVRDDLQATIRIDPNTIRLLFVRWLGGINSQNIRWVLHRWETMLPVEAMRLRLTLEQTALTGMTVISTIREALRTFPTFNWARVSLMFPEEVAPINEALAAINANEYIGFDRDLHGIRSTLYKNTGWVAYQLLLQGAGKTTLDQYRGWPDMVPHETALRQMILNYLRERSRPDAIPAEARNNALAMVNAAGGLPPDVIAGLDDAWGINAPAVVNAAAAHPGLPDGAGPA